MTTATSSSKKKKIFDQRYELLEVLGRGNKSVVYRALFDSKIGEDVALKILLPNKDLTPIRNRLRNEAQTLIMSQHPFVVKLNDFRYYDDLSYLSLEYAPFADLGKYTKSQGGSLDPKQAKLFFTQLAEALNFIHSVGVIHRDVKPGNILVINQQEVRLSDFGVAQLVENPELAQDLEKAIGTMEYIAPEVLDGKSYGPKADFYSLAITFYELITGKHPYANTPLANILDVRKRKPQHISELSPSIDENFANVLMTLLDPDPAKRFSSSREIINQITGASQTPIQVKPQEFEDKEEQIPAIVMADHTQPERYPLKEKSPDLIAKTEKKQEEPLIHNNVTTTISPQMANSVRNQIFNSIQDAEERESSPIEKENRNQPNFTYDQIKPRKNKLTKLLVLIFGVIVVFGIAELTGISKFTSSNDRNAKNTKTLQPKSMDKDEVQQAIEGESFTSLKKGVYTGTVSGLLGEDLIVPIAFLITEKPPVVLLGIEGWTPAPSLRASSSSLEVASNSWILRFTKEDSGQYLEGKVTNLVTGEEGIWKLTKFK